MTPHQASLLTLELSKIRGELHAIRGFMEESLDRMVVALASVH